MASAIQVRRQFLSLRDLLRSINSRFVLVNYVSRTCLDFTHYVGEDEVHSYVLSYHKRTGKLRIKIDDDELILTWIEISLCLSEIYKTLESELDYVPGDVIDEIGEFSYAEDLVDNDGRSIGCRNSLGNITVY